MKMFRNFLPFLCSIVFTLSACQGKQISPEKQAILQEIDKTVEQHNAFFEKEKAKGGYITSQLHDGSVGVKFTGEKGREMFLEFQQVLAKITELNEEYYQLSVQENPSIAYPNDTTESTPRELQIQYQEWVLEEMEIGSKITIYSYEGEKVDILIGDSYVAMKEKMNVLTAAQILDPVIPADEFTVPDFAIEIIQNIEGDNTEINFSNDMIFSGSGGPNFSPITYETASTYYTIDSYSHKIVGIAPIITPPASESLSIQKLEEIARKIVIEFSPDIRLDKLTSEHRAKTGIYFFQWTDTNAKFSDGSHPFIEITLTGKGELFRYINTVILSE